MNHPIDETWMSYLYGELESTERADLARHLRDCADCRAKLDAWQEARTDLDAWELPLKRARPMIAQPAFKWAAAAVIMLSAGFIVGRLTSAAVDVGKMRAAIEPQMRQEFRQELAQSLGEFAQALETKRIADGRAMYAAVEKLDSQRVADYVSLKRDLDTVAVLTDASLRNTEQQLVQLADYAQAANVSNSPQN